ncbi:uncharacterized protein N7511_003721 [Penicillium nucicola]|uniref:uncharacterized protein n=1 Tax=Penicillium nucicola TaxID=1850975 RepID=UPI00254583AE|nr:uncharacterized protein N7511_003721 [Penicillium nucicola]KAJ5766105.1 hypothetical protein N7511_003721 [Penicillium nucicola]
MLARPELRPTLSSLVRELQIHYHDEETDEVHEPLIDTLWELENIESLSLRSLPLKGIFEEQSNRLMGIFAPRIKIDELRPRLAGQNLRSLYLGAAFKGKFKDWWSLGPNEIVFYIENLEILCIQGAKFGRLHPKVFAARVAPNRASLKKLTLLNCDISSEILEEILTGLDGLKSFTLKGLDAEFPWPYGLYQHRFTESYIQALAKTTAETLEYLDLDVSEAESDSDFSSLEHLKHLIVPADTFQRDELNTDNDWTGRRLPGTLENLIVKDFESDGLWTDVLIGMLKNGQPPNLRTIKYETYYHPEQFDDWETMRHRGWNYDIEQFREYGIELHIDRCYDPSPMPENENWPCDCWTYHHIGTALMI